MGKSIVFVNQKGGVGKTTSAINLGAYLALAGKRVLLVDFDPQANLSSGVGIRNSTCGIYEVITGSKTIQSVIKKTIIEKLDIAPSSIDLSGAVIELANNPEMGFFLKKALEPVKSEYDYILIDCPPSLDVLTINGLTAAEEVYVPMQCEYFALEGLTALLRTLTQVQRGLNPKLTIGGIFFTMYDSRTKLAHDVVEQVTEYFKEKVFLTIIPRNVRLSEAPSHGVPVCAFDPDCSGAKSYLKLANEVIARG